MKKDNFHFIFFDSRKRERRDEGREKYFIL